MSVSMPGRRAVLEVLDPGMLSTIQDVGRAGFEHLGVPCSGAADPIALAVANLLVGNDPGAAALELTLIGPRLRVLARADVAIAGADLGLVIGSTGRRLEPRRGHRVEAGDVIEATTPGSPSTGCRACLAVAGGIDVPVVLGSRSTSLVGAFGGFEGRPLRAGDVLAASESEATEARRSGTDPWPGRWPVDLPLPSPTDPIRVLPGPDLGEPGAAAGLRALLDRTWVVTPASDRRGLRIDPEIGPPRAVGDAGGSRLGDRQSRGVVPGAVQLTPSGQPVILMPDAGTVGGYPVVAVVASADLSILGQLVPDSVIRFEVIDRAAATAAARERDRILALGAGALRREASR